MKSSSIKRLQRFYESSPEAKSLVDLIQRHNPIWLPFANSPQVTAYLSTADEIFYGGAAGGGKTDLLLGMAMTRHRYSMIYRREYPQLEGIFRRCKQLKRPEDYFSESRKQFVTLEKNEINFGAVQYLDDWNKFQGRAYDLVGFDEISNFLKDQFISLKAWNRTDDPKQVCKVICAGNPPTDADGLWVIEYWAPWLDPHHPKYPMAPGKVLYYVAIDGQDVEVESKEPLLHKGEELYPKGRTFIPAKVQDNPIYMKTRYFVTLMNLPEPLRSKLLHGDFTAGQQDDEFQVIPTNWILAAQQRWKPTGRPKGKDEDGKVRLVKLTSLGVDVARGGTDETIIFKRYGNWLDEPLKYKGRETPDGRATATQVIKALGKDTDAMINIDVVGVGSSPYDYLTDNTFAPGILRVNPISSAERSYDLDRSGKLTFVNKRSELWWKMRERLDPESGEDISLPPSTKLRADLATPKFKVMARGIAVESKMEIKKRLGRSPDEGDACVYAFDHSGGLSILVD